MWVNTTTWQRMENLILVSVLCLAQLWNQFSLPSNRPSPFGMVFSHKLCSPKPNQFLTWDIQHPPLLPNSYFYAFVYNKILVCPFRSPGFRLSDFFFFFSSLELSCLKLWTCDRRTNKRRVFVSSAFCLSLKVFMSKRFRWWTAP